jgi:hypothetical protein
MSDPHTHPASEPDPGAVRRRDQGLRRTSNATRWSFAAAAVGTAALGVTYLNLIPGNSGTPAAAPAPVTAGQAVNGWTCTTTTAPASAPAAARQADAERRSAGESDDRAAAPAPVPQTTTTCVARSGGQGLTPPGQPPAATQQAPQTRTGAS